MSRARYDGVVYCHRTADFSEISASAEGVASTNSNMLDVVSMSNAHTNLKKLKAGSKMNAPLRKATASVIHWLACCGVH